MVLAALREDRTPGKRFPGQALAELASQFGVHPITTRLWKKAVVQGLPRLFEGGEFFERKGERTKGTDRAAVREFGAVGMCRSRRETIEFEACPRTIPAGTAMRAAGTGPVELVLPAGAVERADQDTSRRHPEHIVCLFTAVCDCVFILGSTYPRSMGRVNQCQWICLS